MLAAVLSAVVAAGVSAASCAEVPEPAALYAFDPAQDMQLPELPTGCEATALATLLRMNGVEVTKTEVADAMPKGTDWVNCFWGDPYEPTGWACMPPCSVNVANGFLAGTGKAAAECRGAALADLPLPCAVWVTIGLGEPRFSGYERDGYRLFQNTHCMVLLGVGEDSVQVVDPLQGCVSYDRAAFERVYEELGAQAVCVRDFE